jgi:LuxR family maltose regulon positive regulatory protein
LFWGSIVLGFSVQAGLPVEAAEGIVTEALPAKISRPKVNDVIERKRLFTELDQAGRRPVVWLSSPAGSGKTTLISSYIDARGLRCLWYQVDEGDEDLATFFHYMRLAGRKANGRGRKILPLLTPEYLVAIHAYAKRFFENLFKRLPQPFALVLDNYQAVANDSPLHEIIRCAIAVLPSGVTVYILSRSDPPAAMTPLRVARHLSILGWRQLRLQRRELEVFVRWSGIGGLGDDVVDRLYDKSDGWMAGIILMLERMKFEGSAAPSFSGRLPGEIFEYFAAEIFHRLDEATQDFLLGTAVLPAVTIPMARSLTHSKRAAQILSSLARNHFFTDKHTPSGKVYQYHPLFRELLLNLARERIGAAALNKMRRKAGRLLQAAGRIEEAAELFREAQDWSGLTRLIIRNASALVAQGRSKTLYGWIKAISTAMVQQDPWLLYWKGQCQIYINPQESMACFEKAFRSFCELGQVSALYLSWSGIVESIEYSLDDLTRLNQWVDLIDALEQEYGAIPCGEVEFRLTACMVAALFLVMPDHPRMDRWIAKVLPLQEQIRSLPIKAQILSHSLIYYSIIGDVAAGETVRQYLAAISTQPEAAPMARILAELGEAKCCILAGRFDEVLQVVTRGLELAASSGMHLLDCQLAGQAVMSALYKNDFSKADRFLDGMRASLASIPTWDKAFYYFLLAWRAFRQEDLPGALSYAEKACELTTRVGAVLSIFLCSLEMAMVQHAVGHYEQADEYLARAFANGRRYKSGLFEFACLLTKAYFHLQAGEEADGLDALRRAMNLSRQKGYLNMYTWHPAMMTFLCIKALEQGIEVQHVQRLIRHHDLVADPAPVHLENWPWAVKVTTMGEFVIEIGGARLASAGKAQKRPLELLQAVIALGGECVEEARIIDALWPDADGDLAMQSLRTTISRLRRLLGLERALVTGGGRLRLDRRYVWTDIWALEHYMTRGLEAAACGDDLKPEVAADLQKVLDHYQGEFLQDCGYPWAIPMRERIRTRFVNAILDIGERLERSGEALWAVKYYRKGLELDSLVEGLYQGLIACYGELGRGAEALRIYRQCKRLFAQELGIQPSPKTVSLLERYIHGPES